MTSKSKDATVVADAPNLDANVSRLTPAAYDGGRLTAGRGETGETPYPEIRVEMPNGLVVTTH
jgi:hypothetical protein